MKKISKFTLKEDAEALSQEEMKLILGGYTYRCCCGMGASVDCFNVTAADDADIYEVLYRICSINGGSGMGGCFV